MCVPSASTENSSNQPSSHPVLICAAAELVKVSQVPEGFCSTTPETHNHWRYLHWYHFLLTFCFCHHRAMRTTFPIQMYPQQTSLADVEGGQMQVRVKLVMTWKVSEQKHWNNPLLLPTLIRCGSDSPAWGKPSQEVFEASHRPDCSWTRSWVCWIWFWLSHFRPDSIPALLQNFTRGGGEGVWKGGGLTTAVLQNVRWQVERRTDSFVRDH